MDAPDKRLHDELRASEERVSFILESAGLGTWDWDLRTRSLVCSPRCLELFGIAAGSEVTYERLLAAVHPEDRERVDRAVRESLSQKRNHDVELRVVWPDGSIHWILSRGRSYFTPGGEPIRMSGVALDNTRSKQAEEDLQQARAESKAHGENLAAVLDAVPALTFFTSDRECRTMSAGRLAREVFHLPEQANVSMSSVEGRQMGFSWLENGRELLPEELPVQQAAATGREVRNRDLEVRFPNGQTRHMFGHAVPLFDGNGTVQGAVGALLDITELKKTEEDLKRARAEAKAQAENLLAVFEAMPAAAFFSSDRTGRTMISNRMAHELLRVPFGKNVSMSAPEGERPAFRVFEKGRELSTDEMPVHKAAATGEPVRDKELEIRFEDGSSVFLFGHAVPLFDEHGRVRAAVGAFLDVTDRKIIEERLRFSNERFHLALRNTPITVFSQGLDLRYKWVYNPSSGYDPMSIIGKRDTDFLERKEDADKMEGIKSEVLRTGKVFQGEVEIYHWGKPRIYHVTIEPQRDSENRICGLTCASFDMTEQKQKETELEKLMHQRQLALDAARMGWWHYDGSTRTGTWDETFKSIFGIAANSLPAEEALKYLHPDDVPRMSAEFNAAFTAPQPTVHFGEYRVLLGDGSLRWVEIYATGEFEGEGAERKFLSCSGTVRDITERTLAEDALRRSESRYRELAASLERQVQERTRELEQRNEEILQSSEQLRQLSGRLLQLQDNERRRIARELHDSSGQILTAIGLDLSNLAEQAKQETVRRVAPDLARQVEETQQLVQRLHNELRTTSYLLHPPLLDEAGLSSAVGWYVQGASQRSGMQIEFDLSPNFGRLSRELELVVFRVVQETLTNILRHSGAKRASIRIARKPQAITIDIVDYGKGIPPEKLAAVEAGASGFGIRALRERLHPFGGELHIESSASGTRVLVTIPQPQAPGSEKIEPAEAAM